MKDLSGYEMTGADATSLPLIQQAFHELRCFISNPIATVEHALDNTPELVMGHVLKAYLHLLGTEPSGLAAARQSFDCGALLPSTDRERRHLNAICELLAGRWRSAARRDLLNFKAAPA